MSQTEFLFHTGSDENELNGHIALIEILQELGYPVAIEEDSDGVEGAHIPQLVKAVVDKDASPEVRKILKLHQESPLSELFWHVTQGHVATLSDLLNSRTILSSKIQQPWIRQNRRLLERALKTSWLVEADCMRFLGYMDRFVSYTSKADEIEEPALDGDGVRIITDQWVRQILEQYPELRPKGDI